MSEEVLILLVALMLMSIFMITHWRQVIAFAAALALALFTLGLFDVIDRLALIR